MDPLEGQMVSHPLAERRAAGSIEWPDEEPVRRPGVGRWVGLAAFAIVGATAILIASGVGDETKVGASLGRPLDRDPVTLGDAGAADAPHTRGDGYRGHAAPAPPSVRPLTYAVPVDGLPALGRSDAKVTLVVAHDYSCAACDTGRDAIAGLRAKYGDDLRVVYKPFAPPRGDTRLDGACAAARQGAFDPYDAAVWRADRELDRAHVATLARDLGLDAAQFATDLERCRVLVRNSRRELDALHVAPPVYFVNGRLVEDTLAGVPAVIEDELVRANQRLLEGSTRERYYREWVIDLGQTTR